MPLPKMEFFTYFRGVGTKRQFRPTTFRDHLERRKISSTKFFLQDIPLPTPQAWARGSRQFKQVVVVDVAVVVVLVEIVVDLHLFHLGMYIGHQSFKQPQYIFFPRKIGIGLPVGKERAAPGTIVATATNIQVWKQFT